VKWIPCTIYCTTSSVSPASYNLICCAVPGANECFSIPSGVIIDEISRRSRKDKQLRFGIARPESRGERSKATVLRADRQFRHKGKLQAWPWKRC
jgi:hypothetical protein